MPALQELADFVRKIVSLAHDVGIILDIVILTGNFLQPMCLKPLTR